LYIIQYILQIFQGMKIAPI